MNGEIYCIKKLLGKGKGGYSYLAEKDGRLFTLKQIHHEPCAYYTFGNKIEAEKNDYERLCGAKIRIPKMIAIDEANERNLKEYIDGPADPELVKNGGMKESYLEQVREMARKAYGAGLNVDWYPTNFFSLKLHTGENFSFRGLQLVRVSEHLKKRVSLETRYKSNDAISAFDL